MTPSSAHTTTALPTILARCLLLVAAVTIWLAASPPAEARLDAKRIVRDFKRAGLDVGRSWKLRRDEWGIFGPTGPAHARRFIVRSLCDEWERPCDSGGRVFVFKRYSDLKRQKAYYDSLGDRYGDLLFSWTFVNRRKRILVQINGELRPRKARRYRAVVKRYGRARPSLAVGRAAGACRSVSAGGRRADQIDVTNLTCRTARRKLRKWMRQGSFPQGYRWWCGRRSGARWICSAGNGGYAPHFTFRLRG